MWGDGSSLQICLGKQRRGHSGCLPSARCLQLCMSTWESLTPRLGRGEKSPQGAPQLWGCSRGVPDVNLTLISSLISNQAIYLQAINLQAIKALCDCNSPAQGSESWTEALGIYFHRQSPAQCPEPCDTLAPSCWHHALWSCQGDTGGDEATSRDRCTLQVSDKTHGCSKNMLNP